jgi:hypothetical protein
VLVNSIGQLTAPLQHPAEVRVLEVHTSSAVERDERTH